MPYGTTSNKWDVKIPLDRLWAEYQRVVKRGGAIALFSQQPYTCELIMSNKKHFRYEWIWQKTQGTGFLNARRMPLKIHENILIFYDALPVYNPQKTYGKSNYRRAGDKSSTNYHQLSWHETICDDGSRFPTDIIQFQNVNCYFNKTAKKYILRKSLSRFWNISSRRTPMKAKQCLTTAWGAVQQA